MFGYIVAVIIWGVVWGFATKTIINNKGYDENWFWWGFFFGFIATIVAACKPENHQHYDYMTSSVLSKTTEEIRKNDIINKGGWQCTRCRRTNPNYTGTCSCGMTKSMNDSFLNEKQKSNDELENLEKLKSYKELLDSGVITQKDFDEKKAQLLNL